MNVVEVELPDHAEKRLSKYSIRDLQIQWAAILQRLQTTPIGSLRNQLEVELKYVGEELRIRQRIDGAPLTRKAKIVAGLSSGASAVLGFVLGRWTAPKGG